MWKEFSTLQGEEIKQELSEEKFPILFPRNVVVRGYTGVALATRFDSHLKLNPKSETTTELAEWALSNTIQIKATVLREDYHDCASKLFDLKPEPIIPFTNMLHVSGQSSIAKARCKVPITINDGDNEIQTVLFGAMGEELLLMDTQEIIEKEAQEEEINVKGKNEVIEGVYFLIKIGYRQTTFQGQTKTAYTIICMEEIEDTSTTEHSVMPTTPTSTLLKRNFSTPTKISGILQEVIHTPPTPANKDEKLKSIRIE